LSVSSESNKCKNKIVVGCMHWGLQLPDCYQVLLNIVGQEKLKHFLGGKNYFR